VGFKKAIIAPQPSMRFKFFCASLNTASGLYASDWKIAEDGLFTLKIRVPFNGMADVVLPRFSTDKLKANGFDASAIDKEGKLELGAGCYEISYMPSEDYRKLYSPATRLSELENDTEVMELLKKELPQAYGIITKHDKENGNLTLGELPFIFYMGFTPELVNPVTDKIYNIVRW
jgi:alpha-L-rhamnosidase